MIRPARFVDIPRLLELAHEMHRLSRYARYEAGPAVEERFKKLAIRGIQAHGKATCLFVAEEEGKVEGFVLGIVDLVYHVLHERYATDLYLWASERAPPLAGVGLLEALEKWARSVPNVIELRLGSVSAIVDWHALEPLYKRRGFEQDGALYRKEIVR